METYAHTDALTYNLMAEAQTSHPCSFLGCKILSSSIPACHFNSYNGKSPISGRMGMGQSTPQATTVADKQLSSPARGTRHCANLVANQSQHLTPTSFSF